MKRVNREGRPFRDKNLCRKGKPCGSVCIPRNKKCKDGSQEVRQKQSDGGAIKNLLASPAYHALLSRKGLVGGSAGVISILGGAGTVVALDLQKISRTTKQGMEAAQPPPPVETFQPGDLIRKQTVFAGVTAHHYAVYVGRDERTGEHQVIQCQADPSYQEAASRITRSVITQKDRYFSVPRDEMYKKRGSREFSRDEIIRRAEALVGTGYTYRPFSSNCENFARGMVEGVGYSTQGEAVSALTMRVADTFAHVGTVLAKKGYLKSRNRKNAQQMLEYLDSMRGSEFSFRQDSVIENTNGNQGVLKRLDYINTLALVPPEESPASEIDLFCDQAGLKRPSKYAELISALSSPLGGLKLSVQQKMLGDYSRMFFGLINLEEVLSSSRKKLDSVGAGRHPPPAPPASSSLSHRKIRSDSLVMNKTIASLSLSDIAMEISASHDIAVDEIYDTEIRTDGSLAGIASSGGTFFEFDINSRSVGVVERPDLTASANERARGSLSAMGIDYRGDSAFEYLRGLESRMDGPFGAVRRAGSAVGGAVRRVAGGQCGRGWKPGPGGKCVRGGGMGRGAKIGAGIAAVGALGAGAVALNRARNKPKALPAAGQTGAGQSSLARYSTTRALQGRVRQGIGAAKGAIGAARGAIGGAVQKFRTPSPAPAGTRPRRKNPTRTYTVDKIDNPKRTDSVRMDGPLGTIARGALFGPAGMAVDTLRGGSRKNGKCGRGWEPGPGGKCVRAKGERNVARGVGYLAAAGALGASAVALNRARNKPKALPAAGQTGRDNQLSRYSRATAMKGKIRQGIQKGVGRVKGLAKEFKDDLKTAKSLYQQGKQEGRERMTQRLAEREAKSKKK